MFSQGSLFVHLIGDAHLAVQKDRSHDTIDLDGQCLTVEAGMAQSEGILSRLQDPLRSGTLVPLASFSTLGKALDCLAVCLIKLGETGLGGNPDDAFTPLFVQGNG